MATCITQEPGICGEASSLLLFSIKKKHWKCFKAFQDARYPEELTNDW